MSGNPWRVKVGGDAAPALPAHTRTGTGSQSGAAQWVHIRAASRVSPVPHPVSPLAAMLLGLCWRRQKWSGMSALIVLAACTACAAVLLLLSRLRECTEELRRHTQRSRQQEEALAAQLQVLYEHRSRLERSLQKERAEHKKTKEDFLQYKLEAQETLNKEKKELADLRSRLQLLHKEHGQQRLAQLRSLEECQQGAALQATKSRGQISSLQDLVVKLQEETRLLRNSHQQMHHQLLHAQVSTLVLPHLCPELALSHQLVNALPLHPPEEKLSYTDTEAVGKRLNEIHPISQRGLSVSDLERKGITGNSELEGKSPEIPDDEKDFGEKQGDEGQEIDTFGQKQPRGPQFIVQEPMDDWRMREPEDQPEEEEEEEKAAGSEDEY
ncbi:Golgi integral membrane protein 4-like isoform X1 [Arapaima gigas]